MRTAAVFATMNRTEAALACVRALGAQTRPLDLVIVADNGSRDSTVADLERLDGLPFEFAVHRMPENGGNAGGVADAMDLAFSRGAEAVWVLDDDSWPRAGALAALLADEWDGRSVRHAHQIDPKTGRFTWPLQVADDKGGWRLAWRLGDLPDGEWTRTRIVWTGALFTKAIRDAAGPVMRELFIRGEDEEYPLRVEGAGFPCYGCRSALMDHPGPANLVEWRFFGKRLFYERGLADWKLHYKVRNMVWLKRRHHGRVRALAMAAAYAAAAIRFDGPSRLPLVALAARDGWRGRLGRWRLHP